MELDSELTRDMFKYASLFSHVVFGRGGVLAPSNFFKERGIWKWKLGALELRCTNFLDGACYTEGEVKVAHSL